MVKISHKLATNDDLSKYVFMSCKFARGAFMVLVLWCGLHHVLEIKSRLCITDDYPWNNLGKVEGVAPKSILNQ